MIYLSIAILVSFLFIFFLILYNKSSSKLYGKRLNRRINFISSTNRLEKPLMHFESKGKTFRIEVEDVTTTPGLRYKTIPVYTCRNIYIDDELVCRLHKLKRLSNETYLAEFGSKRYDYEVTELIEAAYKKAKKLDKEFWKAWFAKQRKESSFYDKKNN